ncbi:hypothetical protein MUN84_01895 [Hymenobacter sp. 5516J-16]|uniref:Magnesium citrate secondary transporter n=1 Tax=Hymenobacter sublimis TaxID=2933777 RepID=A0ABY4JEC5_9BACT|nr:MULTISPECIES: hypothetical protein [Hymenobacter]UOQ77485.1 hypothetical protein MUN84_01895 [Hymenobacter sp. 5516J-16]UPL51155.1 hypothetical protein MWH26_09665 [Hymenobacter sublimis]
MRLPAELRHPLFVLGTGLYVFACINRYWPFWHLPAFVNSHLADLLDLPLQLTMVLWLMRRFYFRRPSFVLPLSWIVASWVVVAVWFEVVMPRFNRNMVADPLDVVAYTLGGLVFWRWMNRPDTTPA